MGFTLNSELNVCSNGMCVTDQALLYKKTRENDDFLPVKEYYDNYIDVWYSQVTRYIDLPTFTSEYHFKLCRAIDRFDIDRAEKLADSNGWSREGMFNRWFFRITANWIANIKSTAFRSRKHPSIICPVCGRATPRIDADHLQHYKTNKDLPRWVTWKGEVYEVAKTPKPFLWCFGPYSRKTIMALSHGKRSSVPKRRVPWPWFYENGERAVFCPFTKKMVTEINDEYLRSLPDRFSRYARIMTWEEFVEEFPNHLIQNEMYSLDYLEGDETAKLSEYLASTSSDTEGVDFVMVQSGDVPIAYTDAFLSIDQCFEDPMDRTVLKLSMIGYSPSDMAERLHLKRRDINARMKQIREGEQAEKLKVILEGAQ